MNNTTTYERQLEETGCLIYTTTGSSMRPFLRSGEDMIVIKRKTAERCKKYDAILYRRRSGQYVLHRIVKVDPDHYVLCGDNCWQREPGIAEEQVLGVLTEVIRNGQKIDVRCWRYQLAVRLWYILYVFRVPFLYWRDKICSKRKKTNGNRNLH